MRIMKSKNTSHTNKKLALLLAILFSGQVLADQTPDAGTILRDQPKLKSPPVAPVRPIAPSEPAVKANDTGPRVLVNGFRMLGATLISEKELQAYLAPLVGKRLSFSQLDAAAQKLTGYYMQRGFIARVFVSPQEYTDGIIAFTIVEGKVGTVKTESTGVRLDAARAEKFVTSRVKSGETLHLSELGEALNILNEQPGIKARTSLSKGGAEGGVDLGVNVSDTPLTIARAQFDNTGSRGTGELQANGSLTFLNPTGHFDAASLLVNVSEGVRYFNGDYSLAVGEHGLRVGANASYMRYKVVQDSLKALNSHGTARTVGVNLSYPLQRKNDSSLTLSSSLGYKLLQDYSNGAETGDRTVTTGNVGLSGWRQNLVGQGVTSYGIVLAGGDADLSGNADALATDQLTRRADGRFAKLSGSLGHMLPLGNTKWNLAANLSGQFANGNLDSSERFTLGGPNGVRAYPVGEAYGDEGWLLAVNLRRPITEAIMGTLFIDHGHITINKETWLGWNAGNTRLDNRYSLTGVGAAIDWRIATAINLSATLATSLGSNSGSNSSGLDADSRSRNARLWINLTADL